MADSLVWLGLSDSKIKETVKNTALTQQLANIVDIAKENLRKNGSSDAEIAKQKGTLLYHVGTKVKAQCTKHIPIIVQLIVNDEIKTESQVNEAVAYVLSHAMEKIELDKLKDASGVGVVVTEAEIEDTVSSVITSFKEEILRNRYRFPVGKIIGEVRSQLKWANGQYVTKEIDLQIHELLGPKTEDDLKKVKATKPTPEANGDKKEKKTEKKDEIGDEGAATIDELLRTRANLHAPGENYKTDGYVVTPNTHKLLKKHLEETGGKVITRFPPEPNGLLHIGHAKAININFGYAKAFNGRCNLRFDDTNPEKEEKKFFEGIEDVVRWLGYTPDRITYSSDNFDQLYQWATVLIQKELAYVCHQAVEEMRGFDPVPSPWRDRPVHESLALFQDMRKGKLEEGEATLRLKLTLEEGKMDPVAYRIKCIYPTYDYTHCLCDSIENISHSLCTKEFQSRRSSYYWLCNSLGIYCPVQWEYGRLNVSYTVVSKRKILKLITSKIVRDWDDPRLYTLAALRRRGVPAEALNSFVARLGLTGSQMCVDPEMLDSVVRAHLNTTAHRTMAVLEPLRVRIVKGSFPSSVHAPDLPSGSSTHSIAFDSIIYIEQSDYRQDDSSNEFRRLTRKQSVGLKHVGLVLHVVEDRVEDGHVQEVLVRAEPLTEENKPKAFVHWVARPRVVQVRLYDRLFNHRNPEDPAEVPGGFLSDCNENSLTVLHNAYVDEYLSTVRPYDRFQFERIGFFSVDPDTTPGKIVFNRTALLKDSK